MSKEAAKPVFAWFKENVRNGDMVYDTLVEDAAEAEAAIMELNMAAVN